MLNNKGFAVSAVLYTLLIAFLIFLAVTLNELASSTNLINHANDELTNGGSSVKAVCINPSDENCPLEDKRLQVILNGKIIYCDPSNNGPDSCTNNNFFEFNNSNNYYIFSIDEEVTNNEDCKKPNCVSIKIEDYNNAALN